MFHFMELQNNYKLQEACFMINIRMIV